MNIVNIARYWCKYCWLSWVFLAGWLEWRETRVQLVAQQSGPRDGEGEHWGGQIFSRENYFSNVSDRRSCFAICHIKNLALQFVGLINLIWTEASGNRISWQQPKLAKRPQAQELVTMMMMMLMMTMMSGWGPGGSDGPVGGNPTFRRCLANTRPIRPLHSRDHNDRRHHLPHKIINTFKVIQGTVIK